MRIITFNVNSLHRILTHPIHHILPETDPDTGSCSQTRSDRGAAAGAILIPPDATPPQCRPPLSASTVPSQLELDALARHADDSARERENHLAATSSPFSSSISSHLATLLQRLEADIICFQEVKLSRSRLPESLALVAGWHSFFSLSRLKAGYSGVVTFVRQSACPLKAEDGITGINNTTNGKKQTETDEHNTNMRATNDGAKRKQPNIHSDSDSDSRIGGYAPLYSEFTPSVLRALDSEGRCVITDHGHFVLFNCYMPAGTSCATDPSRYSFKLSWYRALQLRCEALVQAGRHVIIVGDVNATHRDIDRADFDGTRQTQNPSLNCNSRDDVSAVDGDGDGDGAAAGAISLAPSSPSTASASSSVSISAASRSWLHHLLVDGGGMFVDVFRRFHPNREKAYTYWDTKVKGEAYMHMRPASEVRPIHSVSQHSISGLILSSHLSTFCCVSCSPFVV